VRAFEPEAGALFSDPVEFEDFQTYHFFLTSRYYLVIEEEHRIRPFLGLDLGYIPEVKFSATVDYGGGLTQNLNFEGDDYWSLGLVAGASYLLAEKLSLDYGVIYEVALDTSDDRLTLDVPGRGQVETLAELDPSGFIFFAGITMYF
jgi:outer membrane protein W